MTTWVGPYQVTAEEEDGWVYEITPITSLGKTQLVHSSRLDFYSDASLNVSTEIMAQFSHDMQGFIVDTIRDVRKEGGTYEALVEYKGLAHQDDHQWIPFEYLLEMYATKTKRYVKRQLQGLTARRSYLTEEEKQQQALLEDVREKMMKGFNEEV
jgi:hypothetical protein